MPKEDAIGLWRTHWVNRLARSFNKHVENPIQLHWAGHRSFYAGAIHHVGRKSGRRYVTPVIPQPIPGGFVIGLPYGEDTDWCRNVLAAGKATLEFHEETVQLIDPKVVDAAEAEPLLPTKIAAQWRRAGMVRCLTLESQQKDAATTACHPSGFQTTMATSESGC